MKTKQVSKTRLVAIHQELSEIEEQKKILTTRESELRTKIADFYHKGEDGTQNFEVHGYEVKVTRRINITISKGSKLQLQEDNPELYEKVIKVEENLNTTEAKKVLDELEDYVTTKQGLPTVVIKKIK